MIEQLFDDKDLVKKIQKKLPLLFQIAEIESARAGKLSPDIGNVRERILITLLMYKFGKENIDTNIPAQEKEVDVKIDDIPISIKTITSNSFSGVKASWTVDAKKAEQFRNTYKPTCDILLARLNWEKVGGLYLIPLEVQNEILLEIGVDNYLKLPKPGTNPRGIEFDKDALKRLVEHETSNVIDINWIKHDISHDPYEKWLEYWEND